MGVLLCCTHIYTHFEGQQNGGVAEWPTHCYCHYSHAVGFTCMEIYFMTCGKEEGIGHMQSLAVTGNLSVDQM